jgi:hypothetical protein
VEEGCPDEEAWENTRFSDVLPPVDSVAEPEGDGVSGASVVRVVNAKESGKVEKPFGGEGVWVEERVEVVEVVGSVELDLQHRVRDSAIFSGARRTWMWVWMWEVGAAHQPT